MGPQELSSRFVKSTSSDELCGASYFNFMIFAVCPSIQAESYVRASF